MKVVIAFFLIVAAFACSRQQEHSAHDHELIESQTAYTCPMHPQVAQKHPGQCPICGMDLVAKLGEPSTHAIMLSDRQLKLGNITTQRVSAKRLDDTRVINGKVVVDENQSQVISSRVTGRIEKLYVKETGKEVVRGQPLYTLYSEEFVTLQREYVLIKQYRAPTSDSALMPSPEAAARKLRLYGMTDRQINQLKPDNFQTKMAFMAPASGIVTDIAVAEGEYIAEGSVLYRLEDMNTVWVEAELYPSEAALVSVGDKIRVSVDGQNTQLLEADVSFINPEFRRSTQVTIMRASLGNTKNPLKPGQQVRVALTRTTSDVITVPIDAVIRDQHGSHVYTQNGNNTFQLQAVTTGVDNEDQVEVVRGLHQGDTVVVTGAYLLYSEMILKHGGSLSFQDLSLKKQD